MFIKVQEDLLKSKVFSSSEKLVIAWLCSWCSSNKTYKGGYQRLADKLGISKVALIKVLESLKKKGIVEIQKQYRADIVVNYSLLKECLEEKKKNTEIEELFKIVYDNIKRTKK